MRLFIEVIISGSGSELYLKFQPLKNSIRVVVDPRNLARNSKDSDFYLVVIW